MLPWILQKVKPGVEKIPGCWYDIPKGCEKTWITEPVPSAPGSAAWTGGLGSGASAAAPTPPSLQSG